MTEQTLIDMIQDWNSQKEYLAAAMVKDTSDDPNIVYCALVTNTNKQPKDNPTEWMVCDVADFLNKMSRAR